MTSTVKQRAKSLLSPRTPFGFPAERVVQYHTTCPFEEQYILRMMVRTPTSQGFKIPEELDWLLPAISLTNSLQEKKMGIFNPYVYITVRHGNVKSVTDDLWHVDGFSMRVPHIPEQNYIWASNFGTEVLEQMLNLPEDFDPMRHNIHQYFQDVADEKNVVDLANDTIYRIDPHVIHRRPVIAPGTMRTFFRISYVPIEIEDDTCTVNPLIPRIKPYGREDIRKRLDRYPLTR